MANIRVKQMPAFKKAYKKLHKNQQMAVDESIQALIINPTLGQEKKGDLAGVFVYKFKIKKQEYLLAYQWLPEERLLLQLGVHQNFYRDLKKETKFFH